MALHRIVWSEGVVRLVLTAVDRLTTPLLADDYLALADPLLSRRWPAGRVTQVRAETADATTLVIRPGRGWRPARMAGQYVPVGVRIDGVLHWRTYSLTTPPGRPGEPFSITVRALPDGRVSQHLAHRVRPGEVLRLGPAQGEFHLPDPPPGRLLLLTAGIGITPVMAMLRALAAGGRLAAGTDVLLVHSAPDPARTVFGPELRAMDQRLPWFRLYEHHTRAGARPAGHLTLARLPAVCPDWRERATFVCGPAALLESARRRWAVEGLAGRLHFERFCPLPPAPSLGGTGPQTARVSFAASGVETAAGTGTPLLEAGEAAGVAMPSGCRMGICFGCVSPLLHGRVRDLRTGEVRGEPGDLIQTCVSAACGPVTLDL
ncbi:ferredoxin reductase [Streptomyces poonensis]|uniref:Oxidoreductase n=1 Tax=Streptomyces poonensis TaxID=68255 RepID=A0A918UVB3_9ACTN|nr:ferredoxin reductase [Streptomyces poonensis]GGZ38145.1 oxidoreductase [Streptomyces poonensis]GLJ91072.1 oxidoreductase [Streptomyces poonensis]